MWQNLMLVNSLLFWPGSLVFLIYACGRTVFFLEWKLLVIACIIFSITSIAQVIFGFIEG